MSTHASKLVINGDSIKAIQMGNAMPVDEVTGKHMKSNLIVVPELEYLTDGSTIVLSPDVMVNDDNSESYVVTITSADGQISVLYYDVKSGLRVKTETRSEDQVTSVVETSDYREVNGIRFPYSIKNYISGQELNFKVSEIKVNSGISDEEFK
jgi:outer membrane lipoprotein-sorting protein